MMRAEMSFGPPGANGTTSRMDFAGNCCAAAETTSASDSNATSAVDPTSERMPDSSEAEPCARSDDRRIEQRCNKVRRPFMTISFFFIDAGLQRRTRACRSASPVRGAGYLTAVGLV